MTRIAYIFFFLLPLFARAQTGEMRVYTVAGNIWVTTLGDGGPATAAGMSGTEGVWIDNNCNLYFSDDGHGRVRKVNLETSIVSTVAGTDNGGYSGDGGPATDAHLQSPYGLFADKIGNVYFADNFNKRIRKVTASDGFISTFAGGGSSLVDGAMATDAALNYPQSVYGDENGNIFFADKGRIRKVNTLGVITTIVGTGTVGLSGDGGLATSAQIGGGTAGMLFDAEGNFIFADRGNCRIRKINKTTGIITTIAGTTDGFSGDGGPATAAQLSGPISFVIDEFGNLVIGDNGNNFIRKVDAKTGIITTIAGVGNSITGDISEGATAMTAEIHPEFLYLDLHGNIYFSNYGGQIRKITNYFPGLGLSGSVCGPPNGEPVRYLDNTVSIYPNPTNDFLNINNIKTQSAYRLLSIVGAAVQHGALKDGNNSISMQSLPTGVYLLEITDAERRKTIAKVIKQ